MKAKKTEGKASLKKKPIRAKYFRKTSEELAAEEASSDAPAKLENWGDFVARTIPLDRRVKIRAEVDRELAIMTLRELRAELGLTQAQIAAVAKVAQGEVSLIERRTDHYVSTLRAMVEALGGKLRISAVFKDREIQLKDV